MKRFLSLLPLFSVLPVFAGTATIFSDNQSSPFASGAGSVSFNSYNASSITITVGANAYGGSQQGGGRNYSGYAEAVIGGSNMNQDIPNGSDPMTVLAGNTLTVTKGGDGNWYSGSTNFGTGVSVSAYAVVDGENVQGGASVYCTLTWVEAPTNVAPAVSWTTSPSASASGQSYTVSARGTDADGNLTSVRVWKDGVLFASGGGGDGSSGEAGGSTSDSGPADVVFTAEAVDAAGATSGVIAHTVAVEAPSPVAASIAVSPAVVTAPGAATVTWSSTHATSVAVAGGGLERTTGNGSELVTGLSTGTHTFTITALGYGGPVTQTAVLVVDPPEVVGVAISTSPNSVVAPGSTTVTWSSENATSVLVAGFGLNATTASGSRILSGLPAGTHDFQITAQGPGGPATQTATVTVAPAATVAGSISISPSVGVEPASAVVTWTTSAATSAAVSGPGLSSAATSGSQTVSGLGAGTHTYLLTVQGSGGPVNESATLTVAPAGSVGATISAAPATVTAPGVTTLTWSTVDATAVTVEGPGLSATAASGSQTVTGLVAGSHTYTITAQGPNGPAIGSAIVTVSAAATVSAAISVDPAAGAAPGSTTVTWTSANAAAVTVSGPGINSSATVGTRSITDLAAGLHVFTLTAQGPGGPYVRTATFTVGAAALLSGEIVATPAATVAPGSATVTWSTTNATSVSVTGPGLASASADGTASISGLPEGSHVFTLAAEGPGGPITRTASVTVSAPASLSASIVANPASATAPGSTTLSWSTTHATSVLVSGPGITSTALSDTRPLSGLAAGTHVFVLTAQGPGGPISRTATVSVAPGANVTASIGVSPATTSMGGTATLSWSTANATSVRVTGFGISGTSYATHSNHTVDIAGLLPGQSTWTLVAEGPGGPVTRTATVNVGSTDGLYGSLTVTPTVVAPDQGAILAWTSSGANFRWVHGYRPDNNGVFVYPAPASGSAAVSGLPPGDYSFVFEYGPGAFSSSRFAYAYLTVLGANRTVGVVVAPAGAGAVIGAGTYREGATAILEATPGASYVFAGWSGDIAGVQNPLSFPVGARDYAVVANFVPRTYTVSVAVAPDGAGWVSGAGDYLADSTASLTAAAGEAYAFVGWSGDMTSVATPLEFAVNRNVHLTAVFETTGFALVTIAAGGGTVTPGGTYPAGTVVTVTATPNDLHRFVGWSGDAAGSENSVAVTLDRAKRVQANFAAKAPQTITFDPPGDHGLASPPFVLTASATSGLPVGFSLLGGPATLVGDVVHITGTGPVTVQADQPGNAVFLPAAPVARVFNVIAGATLRYRGQSRTLLQGAATPNTPPFVLEKP